MALTEASTAKDAGKSNKMSPARALGYTIVPFTRARRILSRMAGLAMSTPLVWMIKRLAFISASEAAVKLVQPVACPSSST